MAKRNLIAPAPVATKEDIDLKISDVDLLLQAYFSRFIKTTDGSKSIGDASMTFAEKCASCVPLFPEILSANFDKADFLEKTAALSDYNSFRAFLKALMDRMDNSVKGIKTDVMAYSNKYYGILQDEASEKAKYKPAYNMLKGFYKKTPSDKSSENGKNNGENGSTTTPSA